MRMDLHNAEEGQRTEQALAGQVDNRPQYKTSSTCMPTRCFSVFFPPYFSLTTSLIPHCTSTRQNGTGSMVRH
jgi:hypothetical protein